MSAPTLFVRKATGLVRGWSVFDAFIYATFSINLVTLGLYIFSQMYALQGGLLPTLILSAVFILFEVIVYASLIAAMPRAGGDYMWQSRILGGGIGFVLALTGWWFILWLWVPLYGDMLRQIFFTPLLGVLGARDLALWFSRTPTGLFVSSVAVCAFVSLYIGAGMRPYARIQKFCFLGGMAGLLLVFALLLFGSHEAFREGLARETAALFGAQSEGIYEATLAAGKEAGAALPLTGGTLLAIMLAMPYIVFFNLWPNWGATLYGEVRGASDYRRNFWGMGWALIVTTVLGALFLLLIDKTVTWEFFVSANGAYWNHRWGYTQTAPAFPVWPYPALLASFLTDSRFFQFVVLLAMSLWWFGWSGTVFLSSTRVIFAAAFDGLLPEKVAEIHPRTGTPVYALLLMVIPALILSVFYSWNIFNFQTLTLCATLVIAVTYLGSTIAAILLPYRRPDLYKASPIAGYRVAGIPLITLSGIIFGAFLLFLIYEWLIDPNKLYGIGLKNRSSIVFMLILYGLALGIYLGFRAYRKREGIDIGKVHREIPVE